MNASCDPQLEAGFKSPVDRPEVSVRAVLGSMDTVARAQVVNRTHRVVRQRAQVIKARRSYVRSLLLPLALCSVLLALAGVAVWTGLYQYQGTAEAVQADVASLDANNHLLVALLWFVPVTLAVVGAVWFRRARNGGDNGAVR